MEDEVDTEEKKAPLSEETKLEFERKMQEYNIPKEDPFYLLMSMMQEIKADIKSLKEKKVISKEEIAEALSHGIGGKIEDKIIVALDGFEVNAQTAPLDYTRIAEFTSKVVAEHIYRAIKDVLGEEEVKEGECTNKEEKEKEKENFWKRWNRQLKIKKEEK